MQQLLKVHWWGGKEFIAFDEGKFPSRLTTTERWKDSTEITYIAEATLKRDGKARKLELKYERSKQNAKVRRFRSDEIRYGVSTIEWVNGESEGRAHWRDTELGDVGKARVSVLGGQKLKKRNIKSVLVPQRPQQRQFRDDLLFLDKKCVLTGEKCRTALEAAHLVPVAQNGDEQIENGIILRADLHLLLDAGLIWFEVSDTHAVVRCRQRTTMGSYYRKLDGRHLPNETFRRVLSALLQREKLEGGHR